MLCACLIYSPTISSFRCFRCMLLATFCAHTCSEICWKPLHSPDSARAIPCPETGLLLSLQTSEPDLSKFCCRTADPDGDSVTSPSVSVYYWPNATINAGTNFNKSQDPTFVQFQQHQLANLPFNENGTCQVIADDEKYDIAAHCRGTIQVPQNLENGIYTFLWYWIIHQPALYRIYPQVFEVQVRSPPMLAGCASPAAYASASAVKAAAAAPSASAGTATAASSAFRD